MSRGNDLRVRAYSANIGVNGDTITMADGKTRFAALISDIQELDIQGLSLGPDIRERVSIQTIDVAALGMKAQDIVTQGDGTQIKIIRRVNNVSNPFITFEGQKVTEADK